MFSFCSSSSACRPFVATTVSNPSWLNFNSKACASGCSSSTIRMRLPGCFFCFFSGMQSKRESVYYSKISTYLQLHCMHDLEKHCRKHIRHHDHHSPHNHPHTGGNKKILFGFFLFCLCRKKFHHCKYRRGFFFTP